MDFRGVLVDFGGTLAYLDRDENRKYEEALVSSLKEHGFARRLDDLTSVLNGIYITSTRGELKNYREFWGLALRNLRVPEQSALMEKMEEIRNNHCGAMWKLFDGALQTLAALKKYKLALVSNCAVGTDKLIDALGLASFFSCTILSYEVGVRKPDRRMYLEALRCLGLEAYQCVFVADEISDLEGARTVGLKTILVRQGLSTWEEAKNPEFRADFECDHISDIIKFL